MVRDIPSSPCLHIQQSEMVGPRTEISWGNLAGDRVDQEEQCNCTRRCGHSSCYSDIVSQHTDGCLQMNIPGSDPGFGPFVKTLTEIVASAASFVGVVLVARLRLTRGVGIGESRCAYYKRCREKREGKSGEVHC